MIAARALLALGAAVDLIRRGHTPLGCTYLAFAAADGGLLWAALTPR